MCVSHFSGITANTEIPFLKNKKKLRPYLSFLCVVFFFKFGQNLCSEVYKMTEYKAVALYQAAFIFEKLTYVSVKVV